MRLTQEQIEVIAYRIVHDLQRKGLIGYTDADEVELSLQQVVSDELMLEDHLNDEVREIMRAHDNEIRRADVEYHELFRAIKARLARERNIIL